MPLKNVKSIFLISSSPPTGKVLKTTLTSEVDGLWTSKNNFNAVYETITKSKYPLTKGQATTKPFEKVKEMLKHKHLSK